MDLKSVTLIETAQQHFARREFVEAERLLRPVYIKYKDDERLGGMLALVNIECVKYDIAARVMAEK